MSMSNGQLLSKLRRELYKSLSRVGLSSAAVNYDGLPLEIPIFQGLGADHLVFRDPWMSSCLAEFLKNKPGVVVDIGVNIGLYLLKLKSFDLEREYIGFEPNPACNFYTQELISVNGFRNTRMFPFALSDQKELREFFTLRKGDKMGSLHENARTEKKGKIATNLLTCLGDEFFELLAPDAICVMKIDVEGAELEVLTGLQSTIKKYMPYIYCEVWSLPSESDTDYQDKKNRAESILKLMTGIGYSIFGVDREKKQLREIQSPLEFSARFLPDYIMMDYSNKINIYDFMEEH